MKLGTFSCDTTAQFVQQEVNRQIIALLQALQANPNSGLAGTLSGIAPESPQINAEASNVGLPTPEAETQSESKPEALAAKSDAESVTAPHKSLKKT